MKKKKSITNLVVRPKFNLRSFSYNCTKNLTKVPILLEANRVSSQIGIPYTGLGGP